MRQGPEQASRASAPAKRLTAALRTSSILHCASARAAAGSLRVVAKSSESLPRGLLADVPEQYPQRVVGYAVRSEPHHRRSVS